MKRGILLTFLIVLVVLIASCKPSQSTDTVEPTPGVQTSDVSALTITDVSSECVEGDSQCIYDLAVEKRDPTICNEFGRHSTFESACITYYADLTSDSTACDLISNQVLADNCRQQA